MPTRTEASRESRFTLIAVIAKKELDGISADLVLTIRTCFVFTTRQSKLVTVSTVAIIDKGSVVVTVLLPFCLLNGPMTVSNSCEGHWLSLGCW